MDTSIIKSFVLKLEEEQVKLEEELSSIGRPNPDNPMDWEARPEDVSGISQADPNSRADHIEDYEINVAIVNQLEARLNHVKDALKRVEVGTYGTCSVDGKEIEEARLIANPAADTCIGHMNQK
jgi:RNA polymerase-binding transcription factor DksA